MKEELETIKTYYIQKNSSLDMGKEKISKWENRSEETSTNEAQNKKETENIKVSLRGMKDGMRSFTINLKMMLVVPCASPWTHLI